MAKARQLKMAAIAPKSSEIELTKEQRQAIAYNETSKNGQDASWGDGDSAKDDMPDQPKPASKLLQV